jgi:hypothetical protein
MKILHIWDQASVSCVLAKYQRKLGHEVEVIKRSGFDKFGILKFYNEKSIKTPIGFLFLKKAANYTKNFDVVHVHDQYKVVPMIRKLFPRKKIILHYHGTFLRTTPKSKREDAESKSNVVLVSTPDLMKYVECTYLPNPIDLEHFSPQRIMDNNKGVCLMTKRESKEKLTTLLSKYNFSIDIDFFNRERTPIEYGKIPKFLSNYEYLVDLKLVYGMNPMPAYGMIGLQALAIGMKVINHEFKVKTEFPEEHNPEKIVEKLMRIYEQC